MPHTPELVRLAMREEAERKDRVRDIVMQLHGIVPENDAIRAIVVACERIEQLDTAIRKSLPELIEMTDGNNDPVRRLQEALDIWKSNHNREGN